MRSIAFLYVAFLSCSGQTAPPAAPSPTTTTPPLAVEKSQVALDVAQLEGKTGPDIELHRISDRVWLHLSAHDVPGFGRVEANGLIVFGSGGAVIVDTAWTPEQTRWLLERVRAATGKDAMAMIATHSHNDRAGGVSTAAAAGVPVYASARTKSLLGDQGDAISHPFDTTATIELDDVHVELFYPGAGHTIDNIVVHVREQGVLFGGCLVRAGESNWIGNVADADVPAWPATMDRVMERYGKARVVVPGHGRTGNASLLPHTREVAEKAAVEATSPPRPETK